MVGKRSSAPAASPRATLAGLGSAAMAACTLTLSVGIARVIGAQASSPVETWTVDELLGGALMLAGLAVGLWLTLWTSISSIHLIAASLGIRDRRTEAILARHAPAVLRRFVAAALGASLVVGGAPAFAARDATTPPEELDLGWSNSAPASPAPISPAPAGRPAPHTSPALPPGPAAQSSPPSVPAPASPPATRGTPTGAHTTVVVLRGDSLWSIAATHLPRGATDAEIAAAWPLWYRANVSTIGPDPNRIVPGQILAVPA